MILMNSHLIKFCKREARLRGLDYLDNPDGYRQDRNNIINARKRAIKAAGMYWKVDAPVRKGEYYGGRLIINNYDIEYFAGQYAPTEIYWALEDYFSEYRDPLKDDGVDWKREFETNYER